LVRTNGDIQGDEVEITAGKLNQLMQIIVQFVHCSSLSIDVYLLTQLIKKN